MKTICEKMSYDIDRLTVTALTAVPLEHFDSPIDDGGDAFAAAMTTVPLIRNERIIRILTGSKR